MTEFISFLLGRAQSLYADPTLTYHNWQHIMHMLNTHRELFSEMSHEEVLAIAYHDVVYVPGAPEGVNEDLSKIVFQRHHDAAIKAFRRPGVDADLVLGIIDSTKVKWHLSADVHFTDPSIPRVMDCDLAGLGSGYPEFKRRQDHIIHEYAGTLGPEDHRLARIKSAEFLKQFLEKPTIYHTKEAQAVYEAQARANITWYMRENS